jgi:ankyrin repeat protein
MELVPNESNFIQDGWRSLPKDLIDTIVRYSDFYTANNWGKTCTIYCAAIQPNRLLLQYPKMVKNMDIDIYTKAMICYAREDNKEMFEFLRKNTKYSNDHETYELVDDTSIDAIAIYSNKEYVAEQIGILVSQGIDLSPFVRLLVHQGADDNRRWKGGRNLLHMLFSSYSLCTCTHENRNENSMITSLVLKKGNIDINAQDEKGKTPLHYLIVPFLEVIIMNHKSVKTYTKFFCDQMKLLLDEKDIKINIQDNKGNTPLHDAIQAGSYDHVEYLLKRSDIDIAVKNNDGNTPFHFPGFYEHIKSMRACLTDINFDINVQNKEGNTPLHLAAEFEQCYYSLNIKNVDVNIQNVLGETPLHYSIKHPFVWIEFGEITKHWEQAKTLLKDGRTDVTVKTNKGKTPLHYAAKYPNVLTVLVNNQNIDLTATDNQGRTALHIAAKYGNNKAIGLLLTKMSKDSVNLKDNKGNTALDYANQAINPNREKKYNMLANSFRSFKRRNKKKTVELLCTCDKFNVPLLYRYRNMLQYGFGGLAIMITYLYFFSWY